MIEWLHSEAPSGTQVFELASLADRRGATRLAVVQEVLGNQASHSAAAAGSYLLEDDLCTKLRMAGVDLPTDGELSCLSARRWSMDAPALPAGVEILGLCLEARRRKEFLSFLQGRPAPGSPLQLLAIAEHFFYSQSLKVLIRYTAPRFNHP
jgi:hypothetical protein